MTPDNAAALRWMALLYPHGPWHFYRIPREGGIPNAATFGPDTAEEAHAWLAEWNGVENIYFSVNPLRESAHGKSKAAKSDVAAVCYLHVDVDPRAREPLGEEQVRIEKLLTEKLPPGVHAPTLIAFTGGGFSGFWRLANPVQMPDYGDPKSKVATREWEEARESVEAPMRHLESVLGADHCHNIERIMRLPGTVNLPKAEKRAIGRTDALARQVSNNSRKYQLADFKRAPRKVPVALPGDAPVDVPPGTRVDIDSLDQWQVPGRIKIIIVIGKDPDTPKAVDNSRSVWVCDVLCNLHRKQVPAAIMKAILLDPDLGISESILEHKDPPAEADRQIAKALAIVRAEPPVLHPDRPADAAREFMRRGHSTLMHYNGDFLEFDSTAYAEKEAATVRSELYEFTRLAVLPKSEKDEQPKPFNPTKPKISNIVDALEGVAHRKRDTYAPPCWLRGDGPPPSELIACNNGLLHLPTGQLLPHTPDFFARNALAVAYDPAAPAPTQWLQFLDSLWSHEPENIALLQEAVGYLMATDTSLQKIFLLVGPTRSGKGTIAYVIQQLVGRGNCCAPSLGELSSSFGMEPLVGKQLAVVSDLRLGHLTDHAAVAEKLLSISGEDLLTINRKYKAAWHGRLNARFLILTNLMPRFADASPALANRFVPLVMSESFLGREDLGLKTRLLAELPGIMNWAIAGRARLLERGHFVLPQSAGKAIEELTELASPEAKFLREVCELGPGLSIAKRELFGAWQRWCAETGNNNVGMDSVFSSRLQAAAGGKITTAKLKRVPSFVGVRVRKDPEAQEMPL